jgi:hypothetical protein
MTASRKVYPLSLQQILDYVALTSPDQLQAITDACRKRHAAHERVRTQPTATHGLRPGQICRIADVSKTWPGRTVRVVRLSDRAGSRHRVIVERSDGSTKVTQVVDGIDLFPVVEV